MLLRRTIFSLDISDHSVEVAHVSRPLFGKPRVRSYGRAVLHNGTVINGVIKKPDILAGQIKKALATASPKPISARACILALPDSQVFATVFKFPVGLKRDEIKNTIPYTAEEVIPFRNAEIFYDFKTITISGGSQEVFYAAVPSQIVDGYVAMLGLIGVQPVVIEFESLSLARALLRPVSVVKIRKQSKKKLAESTHDAGPEDNGQKKSEQPSEPHVAGGMLLVDIGARTSNLTIFDRNGIRHLATAKIAGGHLSRQLSKALAMTPGEAEKLKRRVGFSKGKTEVEKRVASVLTEAIKPLVNELQSVISYYRDELDGTIDSVILAGGSALLPEIDTFLSTQLNLPVTRGNPLEVIDDTQGVLKPRSKALVFANVLGLGLRASNARRLKHDINLVPTGLTALRFVPEAHNRVQWRTIYRSAAVLVLLFLIFGLVLILQRRGVDLFSFVSPKQTLTVSVEPPSQEELDAVMMETMFDENQPHVLIRDTDSGMLDVFALATSTSNIVGSVLSGERHVLIDSSGEWFQIKHSGDQQGWVSGNFVEILVPLPLNSVTPTSTDATLDQVPTNTPSDIAPVGRLKIAPVSLGYVNVRAGAGVSFEKVGEAPVGTEYQYWQEKSGWFEIQLTETLKGWVIGTYVDKLP